MAKNWSLYKRHNALRERAKIIQGIRRFFVENGYLEVETPHLIPSPAPEAHINPIACGTWFLHTSPEICMKRLLAAGYDKIFQICRCWREGERGSRHIPEFTILEWYRAGIDYKELMKETEELIYNLSVSINSYDKITYKGKEIDLSIPWERITVEEAFRDYANLSFKEALKKDLFDEIMVESIEPNLGINKPTFICDYPIERASFARPKRDDPSLAERFELYIGGIEIANGFSELTDPYEQRKRFGLENELRRKFSKPVNPLPEKFLDELIEMPPSAGIALGIDRLVMVFLNKDSIDEVVAFTPDDL